MALDANAYGTVAGVAAYTRAYADATGAYTLTTQPTIEEVERFLNQRSAVLNGAIAAAGYAVPVTAAEAVQMLGFYAENGAAADVEITQRSYLNSDVVDDERRWEAFEKQFAAGVKLIASGALGALGADPAGRPGASIRGLFVGGRAGGAALTPMFTRTSLGTDPTATTGEVEP